MKFIAIIIISTLLFSCNPSGQEIHDGINQTVTVEDTIEVLIDEAYDAIGDVLRMKNGITIKWFKKGRGEKLKYGNFIKIDYRVLLADNNIVDGNHLINKPSVPFMVGFKMQTSGWDIVLKELKVGDFVEVFIPSQLARGEKGIKGLAKMG